MRHDISRWAMCFALLTSTAGASEWHVAGDARAGLFASERVTRDRQTSELAEVRARLRVSFARDIAPDWRFRTRVAGRFGEEQDGIRAYLRTYAPTRTGAELGDITLDEFYLDHTPASAPWSLRIGRFQSKFELMGVAAKSLDRNDSPNIDITWTDGLHWSYRGLPGWQAHLVLQHSHRRGTGSVARAPLDFSDSDSRVAVFAGLEATQPLGPIVQRVLGFTVMPAALATEGLTQPRRDSYVAITARTAIAWPIGPGDRRWLFGAEAGHAPNTPRLPLADPAVARPVGGSAWQLSATLEHLRPGHHLGLVIGRADAGWLLSPDFRNNDDLAEIRYQWRLSPTLSIEARYRWRSESVVPQIATQAREDRDAYVRVSMRF